MFVQVVAYSLEGITEEEYLDVANQLAARVAALPGLQAKLWLENPGANRYGAIYFWDDLESMERFGESDLFEGHVPEFVSFRAEEFSVLENLTAMTQPMLEIMEPHRVVRTIPEPSPAKPSAIAARQPTTKKRTPPPRKAPAKAPATKALATKKAAAAAKKAAAPKKTAAKTAAAKKGAAAERAWPAKIQYGRKKAT